MRSTGLQPDPPILDHRATIGGSGFHDSFLQVSSTIFLLLATGGLTLAASWPVVVLVLATDWTKTWLGLAALSPWAALAVHASFATFRDGGHGRVGVVRTWTRAWRRGLRRVGPLALGGGAVLALAGCDLIFLAGQPAAGLLLPGLVVVLVVGAATAWTALAAAEEFAALSRLAVLKAALFCAVRGGVWSLLSLAVVAVYGHLLVNQPVWTLGLATGPVLYLVWANSRRALRPLRARLEADQPPMETSDARPDRRTPAPADRPSAPAAPTAPARPTGGLTAFARPASAVTRAVRRRPRTETPLTGRSALSVATPGPQAVGR
ncbi:MAG: hypothetical protein LBK42_10200 [Propionibacteriaceae bacterium]|jgi:hypothetical protein|nr:hypothetical protein [Propionibacteriaceae bacterium]